MDQKNLTAAEILAIKNSYDLFRIGINHTNAAHSILRELQAIWLLTKIGILRLEM